MKKQTKFYAIIILGLAIILPTLSSCSKYENGPALSLRSKSERVANTWKVDNYKINGDDVTSLVTSYYEIFSKDGNYSYSWSLFNGVGKWEFQNNSKEIKLTGNDDHSSRTLYILKLEENEFWYYSMDGSDKHEFHLISK
ncbi:MAG: hypothetical protein ACK5B9_00925 [Flavobacteriia bacterium]|jgi:hypothetical protein